MENVVDFLQKRSFIDNITSNKLKQRSEFPLKAYIGFDPTADSLHLGNLVGIVALEWMQRFGHTPVILIGGATAKIGDPSGKSHERPMLSEEIIEKNIAGISAQFQRCLSSPVIINNYSWLNTYGFIDFLRDIGKSFRVGPMLAKESVKSRIQSEEGISYTEFSYQILQGYDFYYLAEKEDVVLQMGGSDQWGNITAGIELNRKLAGKPIYGLTYPLITRSDGAKFGKSEGQAIWLDPKKTSPYQFYQYLMQIADSDVIQMLKMLTFIKLSEIEQYEKELLSKTFTPNAAQKRLADEVTQYVHGEEGLKIAQKVTEAIAPGSKATLNPEILEEIAKDMPHKPMHKEEILHKKFTDVAARSGLFSSKSEVVRMIKNGGAYLNNKQINDDSFIFDSKDIIGGKYLLFSAGKKKKILIKISTKN